MIKCPLSIGHLMTLTISLPAKLCKNRYDQPDITNELSNIIQEIGRHEVCKGGYGVSHCLVYKHLVLNRFEKGIIQLNS